MDAFAAYELDDKGRAKLVDYEPADAHGSLSVKALSRLLPLMNTGMSEYEAIQEAYPDQQSVAQQPKLPALVEQQKLPRELHDLTNPIVRRALTEVRKVVNAIVREHGLPRQVVVELAREMKQSKKQRDETSKRNRTREKTREAAADLSVEYGGTRRREDILRVMLWKEQGHVCPYTGRSIPQSALFNGETDIDHILPRWLSGDDSQLNKVLVFRAANREKGNRTPAEWLGKDSEAFREMIHRATERCEAREMPWGKLNRLRQDSVDAEGFLSRQLNDTRYISRQAVRFIELLYPAELRRNE
ncbi:type II CRISPR RNA-guided endonuclease Cas9, partial [Planctomycetota bacterium]|nr:type II CRISPR RNA-guided endonuclease Cas9 [Planctomycetota bacterium]